MDKNIQNITKNTFMMSIAVFFSRILGLVRDIIMGFFFGTSIAADAFNIAFNIPNLIRRLFGEGALSAAFVPIYNEFGIKRGKNFQILFALNMLSVLVSVLAVLTILRVLLAPLIIGILYPGLQFRDYGIDTYNLAVQLVRLMYPYLFFIGLSSTFIAILNSHNKFFTTGLSSAMLNLGWIIFILFGAFVLKISDPNNLIFFAAYGVLLGGFLQTVINLPLLKKIGYRVKIILRFNTIAMKMLWKRFLPAMLGLGVREISLIFDAIIASLLPTGSIAALGFANRLMQLPLGIFGISVGTAVLPEYSRQFTEKRWTDLSETIRYSIHLILYILAPISIMLIIGSETFISLIFQRGLFDCSSVQMTTQALIFYTSGLTFFGLNQVLTPLFFAAKDTKTPLKIAGFIIPFNILLSLALIYLFLRAGMHPLKGIPLSSSITALLNLCIMVILLKKKLSFIKIFSIKKNLYKVCFTLIILGVTLTYFDNLFPALNFFMLVMKAVLFMIISLVIVCSSYYLLKPDYYRQVACKVTNIFIKKRDKIQ